MFGVGGSSVYEYVGGERCGGHVMARGELHSPIEIWSPHTSSRRSQLLGSYRPTTLKTTITRQPFRALVFDRVDP